MSPCSLSDVGTLSFMEPDTEKFPCLKLAYEALEKGGTMPVVLNAANEIAVYSFLDEKINFSLIPVIIKKIMSMHQPVENPDLDVILYYDEWSRSVTKDTVKEIT